MRITYKLFVRRWDRVSEDFIFCRQTPDFAKIQGWAAKLSELSNLDTEIRIGDVARVWGYSGNPDGLPLAR